MHLDQQGSGPFQLPLLRLDLQMSQIYQSPYLVHPPPRSYPQDTYTKVNLSNGLYYPVQLEQPHYPLTFSRPLPILQMFPALSNHIHQRLLDCKIQLQYLTLAVNHTCRSEERRVGKESM